MLTAQSFIADLEQLATEKQKDQYKKYFKMGAGDYGEGDTFIGVPMGMVFTLAKEAIDMDLSEIEKLLESDIHEARTGAVSIMDFQARSKKATEDQKKALYDLYLRRHDRINNWDLVDRSAIFVIGAYLADKPKDILYKLAESENMWERRTAITATAYSIRQGEVADTFKISEILLDDKEDLVHKAVGGWLRAAGGDQLIEFLDKHAVKMPRVMLRYAIEKLSKEQRTHYLSLKSKA